MNHSFVSNEFKKLEIFIFAQQDTTRRSYYFCLICLFSHESTFTFTNMRLQWQELDKIRNI